MRKLNSRSVSNIFIDGDGRTFCLLSETERKRTTLLFNIGEEGKSFNGKAYYCDTRWGLSGKAPDLASIQKNNYGPKLEKRSAYLQIKNSKYRGWVPGKNPENISYYFENQ